MKIKNSGGKDSHEKEEEKTDWGSIWIGALISFLTATQFSIYFSSLWPYLLQLDDTITETFFGYITAVYSLGQALASPLFGFWSDRIKQSKLPTQAGVILGTIGNMIYILLPLQIVDPRYMMMVARFVMGFGGGIIGVLRNSGIQASTPEDRSRVISLTTGAFSLGLTLGPALQIIFTPLSYPGIALFGPIRLNLYSGPAMTSIVANIMCLVLTVFFYRDSTVGLHKLQEVEQESHKRFFALPKFDWLAAAVCIFTRFAQMFVITNLETIGSPLSMTMFSWSKESAVFYNSLMHAGFAAIGFLIYGSNTMFNFGKKMNNRIWCIVGLLLLATFHLLTYPWPFLPGKIKYQEESWINGTEPTGCRRSFEWCEYVPPINVYLYMISYCVLVSLAFALITITMNTVYSVIIGPRNQGAMQGLLIFTGSCARLTGPILVSSLFTAYGPGIPWIIEIVMAGLCAICWVVFYDRLVPLKMGTSLSAGDMYRSKYGHVYKF